MGNGFETIMPEEHGHRRCQEQLSWKRLERISLRTRLLRIEKNRWTMSAGRCNVQNAKRNIHCILKGGRCKKPNGTYAWVPVSAAGGSAHSLAYTFKKQIDIIATIVFTNRLYETERRLRASWCRTGIGEKSSADTWRDERRKTRFSYP